MDGNRTKLTAEPGKQEFFIEREFDAPRELVYRAFTEPELYARWIGPRKYKTNLEKFEPRPGGSWRYIQTDDEGNSFAFHGVNHQVKPYTLIDTFEFEPMPGHVSLETATFDELPGGRTKLTEHSVFQSVEDRDGMIQGGMEAGVSESFDRLDEVLEEMKSK